MKYLAPIAVVLWASLLFAQESTNPNVLVIPKCDKPPVIDGVIGEQEWARAAAFTGFQHIFGWMTERQPIAYVMYDDKKIYFAMDSRYPQGTKLMRVARDRDHKRLCADDTIEIWIAPDWENREDLDYQFLGNSLGVIQDFLHRPGLGNTLMGWNGNWEFKCTTSPGRWQSEVAIALTEVELKPDRDFGLNMCRDYAKYIFTAWTRGSFRNYIHASFGGDCPAVQLLELGPILQADMKAKIRVQGGSKPAKFRVETEIRLESDGSLVASAHRELDVRGGQRVETILATNWADKEGKIEPYTGLQEGVEWTNWVAKRKKIVTLKITEITSGKVFLYHTLPLKEGLTDPVKTGPQRAFEVFADLYPSYNMLRAGADIYDFPQKEKVKSIAVDIKPLGKEQVLGCGFIESFKLGFGETDIKHFPLVNGKYETTFRLLDASGTTLATEKTTFEKKSFPWEGTHLGISDEVIAPFTPLEVKKKSVFCWGREYAFADNGLPYKVVTRGVNILARPIALVGSADDTPLDFRPMGKLRVLSANPGIVKLRGYSRSQKLRVESNVDIEYDGMMKFTLRLCPDEELTLEKLALLLPLHDENAVLFHACGESIRMTNKAGYTPAGQGVVWTSKEIPNSIVLGTFIPYFWLGDYDRGFCWMADNDRGWSTDDSAPAVEFVRTGRTLTARVNFFSKPKTLRDPVEIVFALMAGPPRPEPEGWRLGWEMGKVKLGWFCNVQTFQGYGKPPDMQKYLDFVREWRKKTGEGWGVNMSPNDLWGRTEENEYYVAEWFPGCPLIKRNDYVMWNLDKLMKEGWIDGLYCDDVYPVACNNTVTGCGYVRDDGKVQAGYNMFGNRDFFKRAATLFRQNKCKHGMLVHMTDSMIMPCYCFWDGKHDFEWGTRGSGDYIDGYPLGEICARAMSRQYGMAASWHTPAPGHGDDQGTLLLLHDIIGRVESMDDRTLAAKLLFGIGENDVEFMGYWMLKAQSVPPEKGIKASAWVRKSKGTALVTVANLSKADWSGRVFLPFDKMGLGWNTVAVDAEDNYHNPGPQTRYTTVPLSGGWLTLSVPRHNYRLLLLGPKGVFPRDLPPLGAELPRPKAFIKELCDDFSGPTLAPAWKLVASPVSDGAIEIYRGRLCLKGVDYKFAAAERPFGQDNVSVQVRVESHARSHQHRIGLALLWDKERYVFAGPNLGLKKFSYAYFASEKQKGGKTGSEVSLANPGNMHQYNWVKITLAPESIVFYASADGKNWTKDWEIPRPAELKGAPRVLRLGKNPDGAEAVHRPTASYDYFDDLVVGKE